MTDEPDQIEQRLKQVERLRETWKGNPGYAATLDTDIRALRALLACEALDFNALPDRLRSYIHHLEMNTDPQGTLRENFRLREENAGLRIECERLANARTI